MRRIRLIIEYDGTNYVGWQTQPNGTAIQPLIERELKKVTGENVALHGSGRTDSGVHALAQVAHFDTDSLIPGEKFAYAINAGLNPDVRVIYSGDCPEDFHARFGAKKKHYRYSIFNSPHSSALFCDRALHIHGALDVGAMDRAAGMLEGEHDFAAFKSANSAVKSTVRTIYSSSVKKQGSMIYFDISGSGFMYNMVRILAGTLLEIGTGKRSCENVEQLINNRSRAEAGPTAPPCGLMLMRVQYEDFDTIDYTNRYD